MNNDLISRSELKAYARKVLCGNNPTNSLLIRMFDEIIDNAPLVEITPICTTCIHNGECKETVCYGYESEQKGGAE